MRIALVSTEKLPVPPVLGGAIQIYIDGILPYLQRVHELTVLTVASAEAPSGSGKPDPVFVRIPGPGYQQRVAEALSGRQFDVIHVFNRPRWVRLFHEANPGAKIVLSMHNEMFLAEKISAAEADACLQLSDRVITVSKFVANGISRAYPQAESKLRVVYAGADPERYVPRWDPNARRHRLGVAGEFGFSERAPLILNAGRLSPKKGNHLVIQSLETVMQQHPDVVLLLVGSKWYGKNEWDEYGRWLQQLARNYPGHVFFAGFVPPSDIPRYYSAADVFVCASQWPEPLARVHYEAMAAGLPLITTQRGGNPEVVRGLGNGWVIKQYQDPAVLGQMITRLLDRPEIAEAMGRRGRALVEQKFNWHRVAGELLEVYCEIVP